MSQINEQTVDVDDVIARVQAVARGELPQDAVSVDELRAALQAQRAAFSAGAQAQTADAGASDSLAAPKKARKTGLVIPVLDLGAGL